MTTSIPRGSAQIYEFPPRGRFASNPPDDQRTNLESEAAVMVAAGSSWYHDAAIQEAEQLRRK
jgi:hypothetical protein